MHQSKIPGYAPVNGLNMYYEVYGDGGVPLVLIHGGCSTIDTAFGNILPMLAQFTTVIAVELQGHGHTADRDTPGSFVQDADDVAALLAYLKVDKANFLGFSNGGTSTLYIAIRHPHLINKIVVVSACYRAAGMAPGFFDSIRPISADSLPLPLRDAYLKLSPDKDGLGRMFENDKQRLLTFKDIPEQDISKIQARALIMAGDQDVMTVEHTVQLWRLIKGARLAIVPGTHGQMIGDAVTVKNGSKMAEVTVRLVEEFLGKQ